MSGVPYTFSTATTSIPLSQLDANFATNATIGTTSVGLGNTTTTLVGLTNVSTTVVNTSNVSANTSLLLQTNGGTTAVTIDTSQKVTFANTIGFGSNAGITFNNNSALTNSTLNDYEVGTFNATFWSAINGGGSNLATTTGYYVKVGKIVLVNWNRLGAGTVNNLSITGLPFSVYEPTSGISADSVVVQTDSGTTLNFRSTGDASFSRGTIMYQTSF